MHPLSIKRALANMVVNAARYGNGWIKVSSGSEPGLVPVEDDGPGLNLSSGSTCFSRLYAATAPAAPAAPGWGWRCSAYYRQSQRPAGDWLQRTRRVTDPRRLPVHRMLAPMKPAEELIAPAVSCSGCCTPGKPGFFTLRPLALRSCRHQRGARWRIGILLKILNKQLRQLVGFFLPLLREP